VNRVSRDRPNETSIGEYVRQTHELDEVAECEGRIAQPNMAALAPSRELKACERIDGDCVWFDADDDAADDDRRALTEKCAHAIAQTGEVGVGDRAADGEGDLVRPGCRHR